MIKATKKVVRKKQNLSSKILQDSKKSNAPTNPLATAVWLVVNTALTFKQIADFCQLHEMEVNAIANGTFAEHILPISPISSLLTKQEIERCQNDETAVLCINSVTENKEDDYDDLFIPKQKTKKYTSLLQRRSKQDAILWLLTFAPDLSNRQIMKLVGSTENTVESIRNRSNPKMAILTPKDPVIVGLCTQRDVDNAIRIAKGKTSTE